MLDSVRFVTSADGTQICTYSAGDTSKPAVVFVPAYCCTALAFTKQLCDPELARALHLIAYDVRGQGRSGSPANATDYISTRHAQDFKAVCDAYALDRPFISGWHVFETPCFGTPLTKFKFTLYRSSGGIISADVATAYGMEFIRGVILTGSIPCRSMFAETAQPYVFSVIPRLLSTDLSVFYKACAEFVEGCTAFPLPYDTKLAWIGGVASMDPAVRAHLLERTQDERALMAAKDTLPILVLQGDQDRHCSWESMRATMAAHFPAARFVRMEGVGHAPFYERPAEVNREIALWVRQMLEMETA